MAGVGKKRRAARWLAVVAWAAVLAMVPNYGGSRGVPTFAGVVPVLGERGLRLSGNRLIIERGGSTPVVPVIVSAPELVNVHGYVQFRCQPVPLQGTLTTSSDGGWALSVPLVGVVLLLVAPVLSLAWLPGGNAAGCCGTCSYDLAGLTDPPVCPECGARL
jgi:hypothetical protein